MQRHLAAQHIIRAINYINGVILLSAIKIKDKKTAALITLTADKSFLTVLETAVQYYVVSSVLSLDTPLLPGLFQTEIAYYSSLHVFTTLVQWQCWYSPLWSFCHSSLQNPPPHHRGRTRGRG